MKSVCAAILLIIHFVVSTGFAVSTHYCMGKPERITLGAQKSEQCSVCGMHTEDSNGCCRDEIKVLKLEQDQQAAKILNPAFGFDKYTAPVSSFYVFHQEKFVPATDEYSVQPPLLHRLPVYLSNCVFRI